MTPEAVRIEPLACPFCGDGMTKTPSGNWRHITNGIDCILVDTRFEDEDIPQWNLRCPSALVKELEALEAELRGIVDQLESVQDGENTRELTRDEGTAHDCYGDCADRLARMIEEAKR